MIGGFFVMIKVNFHPYKIIADEISFQSISNIQYLTNPKYIYIYIYYFLSITQVKAKIFLLNPKF